MFLSLMMSYAVYKILLNKVTINKNKITIGMVYVFIKILKPIK